MLRSILQGAFHGTILGAAISGIFLFGFKTGLETKERELKKLHKNENKN
jgi:hypothetical protein